MLNVINEHSYELSSFRADSRKIFALVLEITQQKNASSLSVVFYAEEQIITLNRKYRQVEKKSDVLAFSSIPELTPGYLGDIVICYPVAVEQAIEYEHSLERELAFLFLHGLLHLLGYDHLKLKDEKVMFALQKEVLRRVGITRKTSFPA